ncbi:MAG: hypothetical protein IJ678_02840 [Kiritimatiellae bacterium]|nr:hypothetical protein [Kiritimatiellia bacterium]
MNNPVRNFCIAIMAALHGAAAAAYTTSIADTSGYVWLTSDEGAGKSSFVDGARWSDNAIPGDTKDYLVNVEGRVIRNPATENGSATFGGRSLSLDNGANFILKGKGSTTTVSDLRIYNAFISQGDGNSTKTLKGSMTVFGTPSAPSIFQGSGNGGVRRTYVDSAISGASGTCLKIQHTSGESDSSGAQFYCFLRGDNSGYNGSIEVEGAGNGVCLVVASSSSLGASPSLALDNDTARLFGASSGTVAIEGAAITVAGSTIGVYTASGSDTGLAIGGGSTISGTGTLVVKNSGANGTTYRAVELGDVAISGIDGIATDGTGVLALGSGYSNSSIPLAVAQTNDFAVADGASAGAVSVTGGAAVSLAGGATFASLSLDGFASGATAIRKPLAADPLVVTGSLSLPSGSSVAVEFTDSDAESLSSSASFTVLKAAGAIDASAFTASAPSLSSIEGGTFSVVSGDGTNSLVYTLPKSMVFLTASDTASSGSSFASAARWSDGQTPHADALYFVKSGLQLRAPDGAAGAFPDSPLTILTGGKFSAQGATVTVPDLRLESGAIMNSTRAQGSDVAGAATVSGTASAPVELLLQVYHENGKREMSRTLGISAAVSGTGPVRMAYESSTSSDYAPNASYPGIFRFSGDNAAFTGTWRIENFAVKAAFASAAAVGGASAIHFRSNGVFSAESSFTIPASVALVVENTGTVSTDTARTNGGTFEVAEGETLVAGAAPSGDGIVRKTGAGTLRLAAGCNTTGQFNVKEGTVLFDGSFASGDANAIVRAGAAIGGTGTVKKAQFEDGSLFAVDLDAAEPLTIDTLVLAGEPALAVSGSSLPDRFAVARVGTLSGTLPETVVARIAGGASRHVNLTLSDGVIYASSVPFVLIVR